MTYEDVSDMLIDVGIPTAYYQFPDDTVQEPPFICFFYPNTNDFLADNKNYQPIEHLVVELYTDEKDFDLEARLKQVLTNHGLVYERSEEYIDTERMWQVTFETDVIISEDGGTNG